MHPTMADVVRAGLLVPDPVGPGARRVSPLTYLLDAARLRPAGRRVLSVLSFLLPVTAAALIAYPFFTDVYATQFVQEPLADRFESPEIVERFRAGTIQVGDPLTRIVLPDLGVDAVVVEGTSAAALRAGAGHYPTTPLPGEQGNVAIAGHRTTYGKPFNRVDELGVGAEIQLVTPLEVHTYRVVAAPEGVAQPCPNGACWITHPEDWDVVGPTEAPMLTLTTCHPKGSARERLILRAELVDSSPRAYPTEAPADPSP